MVTGQKVQEGLFFPAFFKPHARYSGHMLPEAEGSLSRPSYPGSKSTSTCTELPLRGPWTHLGNKVSPLLPPTHCPMHKCNRGFLGERKSSNVGGQCSEETCSQRVF